MQKMQMRKAERKQAKLRVGIFGPSGSGKTMGGLKLARGITEWNKICVIDTENKSADLYSHLGDYNVITLSAPFTPEKYVEAIVYAEESGMDIIVIDSITHEWAGLGGILETVDELGKTLRNPMQAWAKVTPRHNKFISAIIQSNCHMICCGRSKQDYVMNQVEKNGRTINVPEKVGLKAITREGFDYEMTVSFDLAINHYANVSKDRTDLFKEKPDFVLTEETGEYIKDWNEKGAVNILEQKREIIRQAKRIGIQITDAEQLKADIFDITNHGLEEKNFEKIIEKMRETEPIPDNSDDDSQDGGISDDGSDTETQEFGNLPPQNEEKQVETVQNTPQPLKTQPQAKKGPLTKAKEKAVVKKKAVAKKPKTAKHNTQDIVDIAKTEDEKQALFEKQRTLARLKLMQNPIIGKAYNNIQVKIAELSATDQELQFVSDLDGGDFCSIDNYPEVFKK